METMDDRLRKRKRKRKKIAKRWRRVLCPHPPLVLLSSWGYPEVSELNLFLHPPCEISLILRRILIKVQLPSIQTNCLTVAENRSYPTSVGQIPKFDVANIGNSESRGNHLKNIRSEERRLLGFTTLSESVSELCNWTLNIVASFLKIAPRVIRLLENNNATTNMALTWGIENTATNFDRLIMWAHC